MENAKKGLDELKERVDSYIVVPNDRIKDVMEKDATLKNAFLLADDVLRQGVQSIADTISGTGYVNRDFADVRSIMASQGPAIMGVGTAKGENRDITALEKAIKGPLLADINMRGVYGILLNIIGGEDLKMEEVQRIGMKLNELVGNDVRLFTGLNVDGRVDGSVSVVVIATGIKGRAASPRPEIRVETRAVQPESPERIRPAHPISISEANKVIDKIEIPTYIRDMFTKEDS
jgi:cell division protein FtsZ